MHSKHISTLDLNLLTVLDALFVEQNVTKAAERLGMSQPRVSRALGDLRAWFGAPLFVRARYGMVPTAHAETLRANVRGILSHVEGLLAPPVTFDAASSQRTFRIMTAEYAPCLLLADLERRLAQTAPRLRLVLTPWSAGDVIEALETGRADLAIAPAVVRAPQIRSAPLFYDRFVTIHRPAHPLAKRPLSCRAFASARHLQIAPDDRDGSVLDDALTKRGLSRQIALRVASFVLALPLVAASDLIATVPARLVHAMANAWPLTQRTTPVPLPSFRLGLLWHERAHEDPGLRWLRRALADVVPSSKEAAPKRLARIHLERRGRGSL